jgi:hypothetical protein
MTTETQYNLPTRANPSVKVSSLIDGALLLLVSNGEAMETKVLKSRLEDSHESILAEVEVVAPTLIDLLNQKVSKIDSINKLLGHGKKS